MKLLTCLALALAAAACGYDKPAPPSANPDASPSDAPPAATCTFDHGAFDACLLSP